MTSKEEKKEDDDTSEKMLEDSRPDMSSEQPSTSKETSPGTVPLSLEYFTFHRTLGEGAFGKVLLATDVIRKERVAIKVSDKVVYEEMGMTLEERNVLQLSHENPFLTKGLAAFHTQNFVYYVMEAVTGGNLLGLMKNYCPFDTATVTFITAELVCGTEFLHSKRILHRDLKPANVLLTRQGHVKITDFGFAVTDVHKRTRNACQGTPGYAPPEMVLNQLHGRGVDYFAIGVILYNLLTNAMPFQGTNIRAIMNSVVRDAPCFPETLTPNAINILEGLLCKDQFQRLGVKGNVRSHPFFSDLSWQDVEAQRMPPPAVMFVTTSADLYMEETMDYSEPPKKMRKAKSSTNPKMFNMFSFVCPEWSTHYHPTIIQTTNWMSRLITKRTSR